MNWQASWIVSVLTGGARKCLEGRPAAGFLFSENAHARPRILTYFISVMGLNRFTNREDAGMQLANLLEAYAYRPDVTVLALPRGGVPVGFALARELRAPLDVMLVRKLGVPGHEELAMGAVASGDQVVVAHDVVRMLGISDEVIADAARRESQEVARREQLFRGARPPPDVRGRIVILVDDGLATGSTMLAAVRALRQLDPAKIIVAVPVGAADSCSRIGAEADDVICLRMPEPFYAVGLWYNDFAQTTDEEVIRLLAESAQAPVSLSGRRPQAGGDGIGRS
jgi:putative phosphoribosyl transferase